MKNILEYSLNNPTKTSGFCKFIAEKNLTNYGYHSVGPMPYVVFCFFTTAILCLPNSDSINFFLGGKILNNPKMISFILFTVNSIHCIARIVCNTYNIIPQVFFILDFCLYSIIKLSMIGLVSGAFYILIKELIRENKQQPKIQLKKQQNNHQDTSGHTQN